MTDDADLDAQSADKSTDSEQSTATPALRDTDPAAGNRFRAAQLERYIGERLRFMRRISGLSQRQVASEIGLSFQQLQKYENGTNRVSAALLAEFSGLFHLPMDWFIGPFNACMEREETTPYGDYAYVMEQTYRALRYSNEEECDTALDVLCQVAMVRPGPRQSRLFRLRRAVRDNSADDNVLLREVVRRFADSRASPTAPAAKPVLAPNDISPAGEPNGHGVLLVDDDPDVLTMLSASLSGVGFRVTTARSGDEALFALSSGARADIIVTDYAMVGMDGVELLSQVAQLRPGLPGIVITGFAEAKRLQELPPEVEVLSKPFRRMELVGRLRLLLEEPNANADAQSARPALQVAAPQGATS